MIFDIFIIKRHNGTLYAKDCAKVAFCDSLQILLTNSHIPMVVTQLAGVVLMGTLTTGKGGLGLQVHQR